MADSILEETLQDDLTCSICLDFLCDPLLNIKCSHTFCKACIFRHYENARDARCPKCRGQLHPSILVENRPLANIVGCFQKVKRAQRRLENKRGTCLKFGRHHREANESQDLKRLAGLGFHQLKDVVKITEIPQQIEAAIDATANWRRESVKMEDSVSQVKTFLGEGFSDLKKYVSHQEEVVLNFIDQEYTVAQERINSIREQLSARTYELVELQSNSEELIKATSLDQEIHTGSYVTVDKAELGVQKIDRMIQIVEEFKRQLETSVLEEYPMMLSQDSYPGTSSMNEVLKDAAKEGTVSSINSSQSQESLHLVSLQEISGCSSAVRPASPEPMILSQFSQWASDVTFDPERLNCRLELSEDKRKVIVSHSPLENDYCPKKFRKSQVLASQGFSEGCHYWEVSTRNCLGWAVGVAKAEIGSNDLLGRNELSWCIEWSNKCLSAWHRNQETRINNEKPLVIGIFLDIPRSNLDFHFPSGEEMQLHRFQINVLNPVYPAFWIYGAGTGGSLTIRDIRRRNSDLD